jgi:hypothetical protein
MDKLEDKIRFHVISTLEEFNGYETLVSMEYIDDTLREVLDINLMDKNWLKVLSSTLADMEEEGEIHSCEVLNADGYSKVFWVE